MDEHIRDGVRRARAQDRMGEGTLRRWSKVLKIRSWPVPGVKSGMCQVLKYTTLYFFVFSVSYI